MPSKPVLYVVIGSLAAVSFAAAWLMSSNNLLVIIAGTPGVYALFKLINELARDAAKHERDLELKRIDQRFALSVTSHMSIVTFDKQVAFCEEYLAKLYEIAPKLVGHGPTKGAMDLAMLFVQVRRTHGLWVPTAAVDKLITFENALFRIGNDADLVASTSNSGNPKRLEQIERMHQLWSDIVTDKQSEVALDKIVQYLRDALGASVWEDMRHASVSAAMRALAKGNGER